MDFDSDSRVGMTLDVGGTEFRFSALWISASHMAFGLIRMEPVMDVPQHNRGTRLLAAGQNLSVAKVKQTPRFTSRNAKARPS